MGCKRGLTGIRYKSFTMSKSQESSICKVNLALHQLDPNRVIMSNRLSRNCNKYAQYGIISICSEQVNFSLDIIHI